MVSSMSMDDFLVDLGKLVERFPSLDASAAATIVLSFYACLLEFEKLSVRTMSVEDFKALLAKQAEDTRKEVKRPWE